MTTPLDIVTRALKDIGAIAAGETPAPEEAQDAYDMLNDMIDQWSNENMMVYNMTEIIFPITSGQINYTIGPGGTANASFQGSIAGNILTVTNVLSGAVTLNQTLSGTGITPGTQIMAFESGAGGNTLEAGTYKLNFPQSVAATTITAYYQKPLAIDSAFVRINTNSNGQPVVNGGLDYPIAILALQEYEMIGLKTLSGPWPKALYYNPGDTLGNLAVWPNPSQGEMHLFVETLFPRFTTEFNDIQIPQGYVNALRWCLAERLMPMYGKANTTQIQMITSFAAQAKATVKRTNMQPQQTAMYSDVITSMNSRDAGWILTGGFFR
jgi:hypothetical protein